MKWSCDNLFFVCFSVFLFAVFGVVTSGAEKKESSDNIRGESISFEKAMTDDPCAVICPPDSLDEGEPFGDDTNGGCGADPPAFTEFDCGEVYCGSGWAEDSMRDTDWYQIELSEPRLVRMTVMAEFEFMAAFVVTDPPGTGDCSDMTGYLDPYAVGNPCQEPAVSIEKSLDSGTHWFFLSPSVFEGYPISEGPWVYYISFECETPPEGACCVDSLCASTNTETECLGMGGAWFEGEICPAFNCGGGTCEVPYVIELPADMPVVNRNMTCHRGNDYSDTCLGDYDGGEDFIYELRVTEAFTCLLSIISLDPDEQWMGMALDDQCPPSADCLESVTSGTETAVSFYYNFDPGAYFLMIDTWPSPDCISDFAFSICEFQANDFCENALSITDAGVISFNTACASFDGPGECMTSPNIWYRFTPNVTGRAVVNLLASHYDTKLAVYSGVECDPTGSMIECNDDYQGSLQSRISFSCLAGQNYLIEVGGHEDATGPGTISAEVKSFESPTLSFWGFLVLFALFSRLILKRRPIH